ncbi:MAG: TolC family protein [Desulfobacterales bacterium]|nr:MAG: TolC family protein [Desulfobacterales bacterium]
MLSFFSRISTCAALFFLLVYSGTARAQPQTPTSGFLSLSEAIQLAITHNPLMNEVHAQVDISHERMVQARSGFMPRIDASGAYTRATNPAQTFATKLNQGMITPDDFNVDRLNNPDPIDNYAGRLRAIWPLYDSGQTWYGVRQAELRQKETGLAMTRMRQQVIAQTVVTYVGLLMARENLAIVQQTLTTSRAHQKMVESRYASGFVVKSDLLRTQVHIANLEQQQLQAASEVEVARAELNAAMGVAIESKFELVGQLDSRQGIAEPMKRWIEMALDQRADLKQMELQQSAAEEEIKKSQAAYLPRIDLEGNYEVNTERFDGSADNYTVGAVVTFNLFSGNRTSAKVREAQASLRQVQALRRKLNQRVLVETRQAYLQADSAWRRIQVARAAVTQAEEALRIVRNRYENGLFTIVDLLNSELALQQAHTNHLRAVHDYKVANANLMLAAGTLDENFQ